MKPQKINENRKMSTKQIKHHLIFNDKLKNETSIKINLKRVNWGKVILKRGERTF